MKFSIVPPPKIIYSSRPNHYAEIIAEASKNIRLSKRATLLLQFYADQANGFSPALALIAKYTGIRSDNVSLVRKQLSDRNLIEYDSRRHTIRIFFDHIQAFAMIAITSGRRLTKAESTNSAFFTPSARPKYNGLTIKNIISQHTSPYPINAEFRTKPEKLSTFMHTWIESAEKMTEAEYMDKVRSLPGYNPELQKPMIEWELYSKCEAYLATELWQVESSVLANPPDENAFQNLY